MMRRSVAPEAMASSRTQWIAGLSTTGSISFGCSFVRGRIRLPRPAAGMTAFMGLLPPCHPRKPTEDRSGRAAVELSQMRNGMVRMLPPCSHARTLPHAPERYVAPAQLYCSRLDEKYLSLPTGGHGFV